MVGESMKQRLITPRALCVVLIWSIAPGLALAYIDPGNGAYMVQALFTIAGAALFYLRHPIRTIRVVKDRLVSRFRRSPHPQDVTLLDEPRLEE